MIHTTINDTILVTLRENLQPETNLNQKSQYCDRSPRLEFSVKLFWQNKEICSDSTIDYKG